MEIKTSYTHCLIKEFKIGDEIDCRVHSIKNLD